MESGPIELSSNLPSERYRQSSVVGSNVWGSALSNGVVFESVASLVILDRIGLDLSHN